MHKSLNTLNVIYSTCSFPSASSMLPLKKKTMSLGSSHTWKELPQAQTYFCVLVFVEEITISPSLLIRFFSCWRHHQNMHNDIEIYIIASLNNRNDNPFIAWTPDSKRSAYIWIRALSNMRSRKIHDDYTL